MLEGVASQAEPKDIRWRSSWPSRADLTPASFASGTRVIRKSKGRWGHIPGPVSLVQPEADVAELVVDADAPLAYVTQTTLGVDDRRAIIKALERRFNDVIGPETKDICYATQNRQSAVRQLNELADVLFFVGAKNGSNANRRREIGADLVDA